MIADSFHDPAKRFFIIRILAVFHKIPDQIAQDTAKVLMSDIRQETPRIRKHADKTAEQTGSCKTSHLLFHPAPVIVKPPRASLLYFPDTGIILKTADHGADRRVIDRI